ncbi:MAG: hypothetical protein SOY94_01180 [Candidatus Limiplasma sp.]|nr:hypothetical protein [Candidatus Limiplasma sp.]
MYNRCEIMKAAWRKVRRNGMTLSTALRLAWYEAKQAAPIWRLYGERIGMEGRELIASNLTSDKAGELQWLYKTRYDRVMILA